MTRSQLRRIATASVLALIGLTGTTALGFWQYSRAHRDDIVRAVLAAPAVPVTSLVHPANFVPETAFARLATLPQGTLHADAALLSCGRVEAGRSGCWVIAPVDAAPGLGMTVVLGVADDADAGRVLAEVHALGSRTGTWAGRVQPAEISDRPMAALRPTDRVPAINVNELAMRWHTSLLDGYLVLDSSVDVAGLRHDLTSPLIEPPSGITWRNLLYAWQWWTFAAFVVFLLARYIIDVRNEPRSMGAHRPEEQ